eukprot:5475658-Pyramimonas_sp.AAC.1
MRGDRARAAPVDQVRPARGDRDGSLRASGRLRVRDSQRRDRQEEPDGYSKALQMGILGDRLRNPVLVRARAAGRLHCHPEPGQDSSEGGVHRAAQDEG